MKWTIGPFLCAPLGGNRVSNDDESVSVVPREGLVVPVPAVERFERAEAAVELGGVLFHRIFEL
ncbi:MAG: hypothetical protein ACOC1U_10265 [Spirochaetota bacterium]